MSGSDKAGTLELPGSDKAADCVDVERSDNPSSLTKSFRSNGNYIRSRIIAKAEAKKILTINHDIINVRFRILQSLI